jgi:hypothetical protein
MGASDRVLKVPLKSIFLERPRCHGITNHEAREETRAQMSLPFTEAHPVAFDLKVT